MTGAQTERFKRSAKWFVLSVVLGFLVPFVLATMMAAAIPGPGGWDAWRVGAFTAGIAGGIWLIVSVITYIVYGVEG